MQKLKQGFTLVEIMVVVGIIALLVALALPGLLRARISANESSAQATLKSVSNALEAYSVNNGNAYPTVATLLIGPPPYLNKDYFSAPFNGYNFAAVLSSTSYTVTAVPVSPTQGLNSFTITTGAVLTTN